MAAFKLACVVGADQPDHALKVIAAFEAAAKAPGNWEMLKMHPMAALDVLDPYLNACFSGEVAAATAADAAVAAEGEGGGDGGSGG